MRRTILSTAMFIALTVESARATMIVAIPTVEGPVVATDSRVRFGAEFCDSREKIVTKRWPERSIFVGAGLTRIYDESKLARPRGTPCEDIASNQPLLDVVQFATERLAEWPRTLDAAKMQKVGEGLLNLFARQHIGLQNYAPGDNLFAVLVARFNLHSKRSTVAVLETVMRTDGAPGLSGTELVTFAQEDHARALVVGDHDFLNRNVLPSVREDVAAIEKAAVRDVTVNQALALAVKLIQATEQETDRLKTRWTVGGPVRAYLAGRDAVARPLR